MTRFKKYISIILTAAIMLCFAGCSKDVDTADTFFMKKEDIATDVVAESENTDIFCDVTGFKELVRVSKTDMTALCFSEDSLAVSVYDSGSRKLWRSLPESYTGEKSGVICITLLIDGNEYTLNSQSDCKVSDGISYEINEDSIKINYTFAKKLSDGTCIDITVPVLYKGADGTVSVSVDLSAVDMGKTDSKVIFKSVSLLPWLGAYTGTSQDDFILIPDGSGALIDTGISSDKVQSYEVGVYSADGASAVLPVFGMKSGEGAFVAVIDEGDAIAKIRAYKASDEEGSNRVYSEFDITPTADIEDGCYVSSVSYKGTVKISYRFISKENADYTAMAMVARELLIRKGSLSTGNNGTDGGYPFNLSLIGVADSEVYTDFAQCYDILSALNSRGINNINLRYRGIFEGGTEPKSSNTFSEKLGDEKSLSELEGLVSSQGINVYPETNLFAFSDSPEDVSLDITGKPSQLQLEGFVPYRAYICSLAAIDDNVNGLLYSQREGAFTGICINDGGKFLAEDFSKGEVSLRSDMRNMLFTQANGISATKKLMVNRGNLYAVKYADIILELPDRSSYGEEAFCVSIPFVQTVLHGICDYSLSPINLADNSTDAFLKAIEYGAVPHYEWYYVDTSDGNGEDRYHYLNWTSRARQQYDLARAALGDLRGSRITDHGKAAENVYYTVYDNETEIYVNYSDEAMTVSGVTVEAKSFLRVN